MFAVKYQS